MNKLLRRIIPVLVASLVGNLASAQPPPAPEPKLEKPFVSVKGYYINLKRINYVEFRHGADGTKRAVVEFGEGNPLRLIGGHVDQLIGALGGPDPGHAENEAEDNGKFLAFDAFDGKLGLNWKPVRPDPSHVSLTKNPGKLTITTQRGSIHGAERVDEFGAGLQAKNLFLIDNPLSKDADFIVTTCVSGFTPQMSYQQAGLIVYNDDDNYLKWGYEYNWPKGEGQSFCLVSEKEGEPEHHYVESESGLSRYWLRLTKRGNRYEYAASTDGKDFRVHGEVAWGDGAPPRIGVLAKNGGNEKASELDASFDFFELRAPVAAREQSKN